MDSCIFFGQPLIISRFSFLINGNGLWEGSSKVHNKNAELIDALVAMGRLPLSSEADPVFLESFQGVLEKIEGIVTKEDAVRLLKLLGPDDCFGLARSIIHASENCEELPSASELHGVETAWIDVINATSK